MPRSSPSTAAPLGTDLRVRLLGQAAWSRGAAPAVALERRDAGVLAYVALEGDSARGRLVELLWPDVEPDIARNNFRQRLYLLRAASRGGLAAR